jgi:ABC-2 type transport system permease protein
MIINAVIKGFIKKEFTQVFRDPRMKGLLFLAPLLQLTLFGIAITNEVSHIKLATLWRGSNQYVLEQFEQKIYASTWFEKAILSESDQEKALIDPSFLFSSGQAEVVLMDDPQQGKDHIQALINGMNIIRAQGIESYLQSIFQSKHKAKAAIRFETRLLYNPTMETSIFMVPGVMCMLVCVITIILTSMSMAKEKEGGTFEMIIATPAKPWEIFLGKTIPYVLLGLIVFSLVFILAIFGFQVPMRGNAFFLFFAAFLFVCTTVSIGTLISSIAGGQQQAMMGSFLFLFPAILLSGVMFPLENMPAFLKILAWLDPINYFVVLVRNIMLKGGEHAVIMKNMSMLFIMSFFTVSYSIIRFRKTI